MKYLAEVDGHPHILAVDRPGEVTIDGETHEVDLQPVGKGNIYSILLDGQSYDVYVERIEGVYYVKIGSERLAVTVEDERLGSLKRLSRETGATSEATIKAPMPGLVVAVRVEVGQQVEANQGIVILEAMKMENEIRAPRAGTIKAVKVSAGQKVNQGDTLVAIE